MLMSPLLKSSDVPLRLTGIKAAFERSTVDITVVVLSVRKIMSVVDTESCATGEGIWETC